MSRLRLRCTLIGWLIPASRCGPHSKHEANHGDIQNPYFGELQMNKCLSFDLEEIQNQFVGLKKVQGFCWVGPEPNPKSIQLTPQKLMIRSFERSIVSVS